MDLFVNCRVYAFDPRTRRYAVHEALAVDEGRIVALGRGGFGAGIEPVDLGGATVVPAFADCHVHLSDTGFSSGARDLRGIASAAQFAERIAALPSEEVVYAANYDDAGWPDGEATAVPLDRFFPDRLALVVRVDGHSSLVNRKTLLFLNLDAAHEGVELGSDGSPTGRLFLAANWRAQAKLFEVMPTAQRRAAERTAYALALSEGALHLHAQLIGFGSFEAYAAEIAALRALGRAKWHPKVCEPDPDLAFALGLPYVGGDVFLDGSLGSGTAAMLQPYEDRAGSGWLTYSDAALETFFARAEALGISAGVHAIGDRAIEQCLRTWERVLGGVASTRTRHFVEHFEVASPDQIARAARLRLFLSMQPQFDASWGGDDGMYAKRLGRRRARGMNALGSALGAGVTLCGGDDSPVCKLSPLAGMAAACAHHNEAEQLTPLDALTMYAYDAARFGHAEHATGTLLPGFAADFVVLDRDPLVDGSFARTRVLETWSDGVRVHPAVE